MMESLRYGAMQHAQGRHARGFAGVVFNLLCTCEGRVGGEASANSFYLIMFL
jgi:hypothetical protein